MEILKCEQVTKTYGSKANQVTALKEISFSVKKGELVAITGASGSGKSTLLHIIGTVDQPTSGTIYVDGTNICTLNAAQSSIFRRRKVGLIYQFYNLIPTLTVRENILLPMKLDKKKPEPGYYDEIIETLGLQGHLNSLPGQLSGGQQQRTAIGRALLFKPALLLADEPTGNLDQKNSREIIDLLKRSNRKFHQTILLVTHDEAAALEAERIITVEDGMIASDRQCGSQH